MDFTGEWISEEGHTFIISDCNRNTISGKLILKYDYDMIDSKFNGVVLIKGLDRIDFCFWIDSDYIEQKKYIVIKSEISKNKNQLDAKVIKYCIPIRDNRSFEAERIIFKRKTS